MKRRTQLAAAVAIGLMAGPAANAMPIIVDGNALKGILDGIAFNGEFNQDLNDDQFINDGEWGISGSGGAIGVPISSGGGGEALIANNGVGGISFGIYGWGTRNRRVELFNGDPNIGQPLLISIKADGSVFLGGIDTGTDFNANKFGFFISDGVNTWFSDWKHNPNMEVHVGTYAGNGQKIQIGDNAPGFFNPGEFIYAWELSPLGDFNDYADFVVLVESVDTIPEPGSLALLGLGLAGLGMLRRRLR